MVAPTGVNAETPQDPATVEPPGLAMARLSQAEAVTGDQARPAADPKEPAGDVKGPAGELDGTAPGEAAPAGSAVTEPVPAEAVPAQAEPVEAKLAEAEPTEAVAVLPDAAEAESAESQRAEAGTAEAGEPDLAAGQANRAGEAREPGERQEAGAAREAAEAQEAAETQEASRDVGPLAVVGIIVGVIVLVGVAAGVLAMVTHGFKPKTVVTYRPAAVYGLRPGQCVNAGPNSLSFTLVSCASPHDAEVFARFSLPAAAWPGSSAVRQKAGDGCASRLSGYLNPQLASIGLTQEYVYPNRDAWEANQRTVVCEVSSGSGRLTGSVRAKS
jgi:putative regulator of septum formation